MEAARVSESNGAIFSCSVDNLADRSEQRLVATRDSLLPGFGNLFEDYRGSMFDAGTVRDELLVLAAQRGDHCAFEMLVYRHRAKVLRTAMRLPAILRPQKMWCKWAFRKHGCTCRNLKGILPFRHG